MTEKHFDDNSIVVSISCITYNHAPYIRQCLDGFLMQQTNFAFEVLIHDDASTDGTTEIIKEYEAKYPDVIKPIYEGENQWVKGRRGSVVFNFPRAKGKYIALCEGDDYWTDPLKLQKQVDFLDNHPGYVMCSHGYNSYLQCERQIKLELDIKERSYTLDYLLRGGWLFHPLTVLFLRSALQESQYYVCKNTMDAVLFYFLLKEGAGFYMADKMAVYRIHSMGVWSGLNRDSQLLVEFKARLALYDVEQNREAATYLLTQFTKPISRLFLLKQYKVLIKTINIIRQHFGWRFSLKLCVNKFIQNRIFRELVMIISAFTI